ncbi:hypothetical protein [Archangium lansingense]|uniref:Uncharacterized protein n=1 Tax=Archangium lansingense TaxID=2995310 RepID=A0ABT4AF15_9BACT|nr:hypothetical protein [Archangium lansinium]MCY1080282.1 hypothetical protein [Archangium lansinium]
MSDSMAARNEDYGTEAALRLMADDAERQSKDIKGRELAAKRLLTQFLALGDKQRRDSMRFDFEKQGEGVKICLPTGPSTHPDIVHVRYANGTFVVEGGPKKVNVDLAYDAYLGDYVPAQPRNEGDVPRPPLGELIYAVLKATERLPAEAS